MILVGLNARLQDGKLLNVAGIQRQGPKRLLIDQSGDLGAPELQGSRLALDLDHFMRSADREREVQDQITSHGQAQIAFDLCLKVRAPGFNLVATDRQLWLRVSSA